MIFSTKSVAHLSHYNSLNTLEYELFRNDQSIGFHNYKFEKIDSILKVESIINFSISKLGVNLFSYSGNTQESYKTDQLIKFSSNTNQNKKIKNTKILLNKNKNELIISGSENQLTAPIEYSVGTWWNHKIIKSKAQISAVSGRIIEQKVTFLGKKKINLYGRDYEALHFNFKSTDEKLPEKKRLNIDVWYEENTNLWLKAAFNKTGYWEYRLKNYN